ncbi:benzoate/H(+) symporter BenE family transporter [Nakamurella deserti]|uniref:benzoate/H(+) symporter BenE family transporter n=1 Tax=Nakamurella deserti TaxID=2164074 RepID=UPI00197B540D|nr:benzoate/H(+) symporter BenE family transporter [Nakamurella deserti]
MNASRGSAVLAGVVTGIVGFTSAFAVVLTGLRAVGASDAQAASGLLTVCLTMGAGCILLSWRYRMPITLAWSTPGAALLAGAALPAGGYPTAIGAFLVAGALYVLTAVVRPLGRWVERIPAAVASAMLAGVLLTLCVQPFRALADQPAAVAPVLVTWLVLLRFNRRWAVPGAFVVALLVIALDGSLAGLAGMRLAPTLVWTTPAWDLPTVLAVGLPLYLVTMTGQNIPGVAVLGSFGYRAPLAPSLLYSGTATVATAGLGGFSINLAAISAALAAGPEAHPDPDRRWIAGIAAGATYLAFGPLSAVIAAVSVAAPPGIIAAIAGVALIGAFAQSAGAALADARHREAGAVTFVVAASGIAVGGVSAAFWALVAGGLYLLVVRAGTVAR